jgi:hypothetical protein
MILEHDNLSADFSKAWAEPVVHSSRRVELLEEGRAGP